MRAIKFRGKRVDTGEWIYGSLDLTDNKATILWDRTDSDGDIVPWFADVVHETVGQFTGLLDKNGNEIYEGDIISQDRYPFYLDGKPNYVAVVEWNGCGFGAWYKLYKDSTARGISVGCPTDFDDETAHLYGVVDNIHDNPGMLKGDHDDR